MVAGWISSASAWRMSTGPAMSTSAERTLKVSIAADYGCRNGKVKWEGRPCWNTVTLFNESIVP